VDRRVLFLGIAAVSVAAIIAVTYFEDLARSGNALPSGCVMPPGGFLVIASSLGYNQSVYHQTLSKPWPVITVQKGATVNIVVCNTDRQAHGFQIAHYFESNIETLDPGQVLKVSFTADQTGTFQIYCSIFCTIHLYMQNGQLTVSP